MKREKVDRYLTDLKELPDNPELKADSRVVSKLTKDSSQQQPLYGNPEDSNKTSSHLSTKKHQEIKLEPYQPKPNNINRKEVVERDYQVEKAYSMKDIVLGIVNLLSIVLLVFILVDLPKKARELRDLRINVAKNQIASPTYTKIPEDAKVKSAELEKLFLDDFGVINFAVDIEKLKAESPAIKKISFTSPKPVKDRLGFTGIPAVITIEGNWLELSKALYLIEKTPYLFRPVNIKAGVNKENKNVIVLHYGIFLYVGDKFSKN
jgi:hypothetical protein